MKPAARSVDFSSHELGQDQKNDAGQIHRQCAPPDPAVIDKAHDHEGKEADQHPIRLFAPEIRRDRVLAHVGRTVDRDHAENRECEHVEQQKPVEPKQLAQKWCHVDLSSLQFQFIGPNRAEELYAFWPRRKFAACRLGKLTAGPAQAVGSKGLISKPKIFAPFSCQPRPGH